MRTGPVSAPNERGPVAWGQGKELHRNMDGEGGGRTKPLGWRGVGAQGDRSWHLSLVTLPSRLIRTTR